MSYLEHVVFCVLHYFASVGECTSDMLKGFAGHVVQCEISLDRGFKTLLNFKTESPCVL